MARKEIGSVWDRSNRNAINENFRELYGLKDVADSAKSEAGHAVQTANYAKTKAESVQAQFNQVVIEGDSSVEAAQARVDAEGKSYPTLKARLDAKETEFSSQLAQTAKVKFHFLPVKPIATNPASGDSSLIVTKTGKTILIDTGASESYTLIRDYLNNIGVTKIDYLILSHYHSDHIENLSSLMADFNFSSCIAYIQKDSAFVQDGFDAHNEYTNVKALLNGNTVIEPNNGDNLSVDDISIKFFNCSQDDINYYNANSTNYNDQSMCCEVTHRNTKTLFTGDIHTKAQTRLYEQGYFSKVDLLKVQHHGFDRDVNTDYIQTVRPKYSVTSISLNSYVSTGQTGDISTTDTYNSGLKSIMLAYLEAIGCKNYILGYTGGISFTSDGFKVEINDRVNHQSHGNFVSSNHLFLYVDKNTTVDDSDGTKLKPFRKIQEAIAFCSGIPGIRFNIQIADGNYDEDIVIVSPRSKITLTGNLNNKAAVKIKSLTVYSAHFFINSINITGEKSIVVLVESSNGRMDNCLVDGVPASVGNPFDGRGVCAYNSNLYLDGCEISNKSVAVGSFNGSMLAISDLKGANNEYIALAQNGDINSINFAGSFNKKFLVKINGDYTGDYTKGTTVQRLASVDSNTKGQFHFFDTDLEKLFIWNGSKWVDSTVTISDWIPVSLENGATNWGGNITRYRIKDTGGHKEVEFYVSVKTIAPNTTFFTMPTELRPKYFNRFPISMDGASWAMLEMSNDGALKIAPVNGYDSTNYALGYFSFPCD